MSPVLINGRMLGVQTNGLFTDDNTLAIPGGRLWTEAARSWRDMRTAAIEAGIPPAAFVPNGPASSARSVAQLANGGKPSFIRNAHREVGIDLDWSDTPVYEWKLLPELHRVARAPAYHRGCALPLQT